MKASSNFANVIKKAVRDCVPRAYIEEGGYRAVLLDVNKNAVQFSDDEVFTSQSAAVDKAIKMHEYLSSDEGAAEMASRVVGGIMTDALKSGTKH